MYESFYFFHLNTEQFVWKGGGVHRKQTRNPMTFYKLQVSSTETPCLPGLKEYGLRRGKLERTWLTHNDTGGSWLNYWRPSWFFRPHVGSQRVYFPLYRTKGQEVKITRHKNAQIRNSRPWLQYNWEVFFNFYFHFYTLYNSNNIYIYILQYILQCNLQTNSVALLTWGEFLV